MWQTRREFIKSTVGGGTAVLVSRLVPFGALASGTAQAAVMDPPNAWSGPPGEAHYRIDGLAKVTGQKIYARDFHPRDMPGWPTQYRHAFVLRTDFVDHLFEGVNLKALPKAIRPTVVITGEDLARDGIGVARPDYPGGNYLLRKGERPRYFGQEAAILLFDEREALEEARRILLYEEKGARKGKRVPVPDLGFYSPETSIIHVTQKNGDQEFAQTLGGPVHPSEPGKRNAEAMEYVEQIDAMLESGDLEVFQGSYSTQITDPMFMEPENGLGWLDPKTKTMHLLIGTQSPGYDVNSSRELFEPDDCKIDVDTVHLYAAYPGGGFGGRDTSILCLWLSLAAAYSDKPIRIAHDRFQQFQSGVKRHASKIDLSFGLEEDNTFKVIRNYTVLNGGGRINVSSYVASVAGILGTGPYNFDYADIWSRPQHTTAVVAGSMRGFGAFQSFFAVESLVDEIAVQKGLDPIDLRIQNLLKKGTPISTGAPVAPPGLREICESAKNHELWRDREILKRDLSSDDFSFGVGFALAMKNYGTGADAVMAAVSLDPTGKLILTTNSIDMGQGLATALALSTADSLGKNADEIETGEVALFENLKLVDGFKMQKDNPRWTPVIWNSTKASSGSSRWAHAVEQASQVLLATGMLPAARSLWGRGAAGIKPKDIRWKKGQLSASGFAPIPLRDLAKRMHEKNFPVSSMIHAFHSGVWVSADYTVGDVTERWEIDALAVQLGGQAEWKLIDRKNPKLYTVEDLWMKDGQTLGSTGALASVMVNRRTGEPTVVGGVHYAAPGKMIQRDLVEGQMDGQWAMGIGHALLEDLPNSADGAANGTWNLNRYYVPLARDCAIESTEKVLLPPESPDAPARGMGEVPLLPVAPSIANAIAHATGHRFRSLPITAEKIRAKWS